MSFFSKILEKLGMRKADASEGVPSRPASTSAQSKPTGSSANRTSAPSTPPPSSASNSTVNRAPAPVAMVDVVSQLETRASQNPQKLNWRTSIVDLLKLLDIDSSLQARKDLAQELGAPADVMEESAKMNVWLHRTVLQRIASNGGNVPKELLD